MESNNSNAGINILIYISIVLVIIGGCGLDSENIIFPLVFIMLGFACGMVAYFAGKDL